MSKGQDLRDQSIEDLQIKYEDLQKERYQLKNQSKQERKEKSHRFGQVRKDISRVLTILTEKNVKL